MSETADWIVAVALLVLLVILTAGCQTVGDAVRVLIPVAKSCAVKIDPRPVFPDTKDAIVAATNIEARVNLILAGRLMRDKRLDEVEAALSECQK